MTFLGEITDKYYSREFNWDFQEIRILQYSMITDYMYNYYLRLQYTFRSSIFPEIGFLPPSNSPSVIFHLKKKVLKKSEYRRRNEHISFLAGSKNSSLE